MLQDECLKVANVYFHVLFADDELSIPIVDTYIYVGKNLFGNDGNGAESRWYFQDPDTYMDIGPFNKAPKGDYGVLSADDVTLEEMYDSAGLAELLVALK